ncbi:MAG: hypothetical protein JSU63_21375 [Phycisphaerales bacterium]|nr:MAG: hypothetical protein JSU63_21375 [Phycisphaerales bacterium]
MNESEIERLKQRAHREYAEEKARIEAQIARLRGRLDDLESRHAARVEAIRWMSEEAGAANTDESQPESARARIRAAIAECPTVLTRMDVESTLASSQNGSMPSRGVIVDELGCLVAEGYLSIAVQGRGRRPTLYEKVGLSLEE